MAVNPEVVDALPELHRPWIDEVLVRCEQCGESVKRIPEVGDCWLDAGIVPFSTLGYLGDGPGREYWEKWYPADWISEMREQIRLWFYSQLFMSVTLEDRAPYRAGAGLREGARRDTTGPCTKAGATPSSSTRPPRRWGPT